MQNIVASAQSCYQEVFIMRKAGTLAKQQASFELVVNVKSGDFIQVVVEAGNVLFDRHCFPDVV